MGSRQIVLVSTAGISVLNAGIFWRKAKTKRLFSQCIYRAKYLVNCNRKFNQYTILLGPPGCAQVFPYLSPGPLDFLVV